MSRPPRPATAAVLAAVAMVLAAVAPAVAATDAVATEPASGADSLDAAAAAPENATVDAWRVPVTADPANASASDLASHANRTAEVANVTPQDRLVLDVAVPGLDEHVAAENASANLTVRVLDALEANGSLAVGQTQATTPPEILPGTLWLNATNVRAVATPDEDRYLLVVDQRDVLLARVSAPTTRDAIADAYAAGDDYRFEPLYADGSVPEFTARYYANDSHRGLVDASTPVRFVDAHATVAADGPLEPDANATVAGTTTLAPGTDLLVTAGTDAGVVATAVAAVDARGRYAATLDLAAVDAPATLNVTVAPAANRSHALTDAPATLAVRDPHAAVAFADQATSTGYVSARANLSHGGYLLLRHDGDVVDVTNPLSAGVNQTATFGLPANATAGTYTVVAYRGTASDPGERYANGTADATITFANDTTTTPTTATTSPTTPPTTTYNETPILGDDTTTSRTDDGTTTDDHATTPVADDPIPGFGVAVALAALAATLLVVGRREPPRS